MRFLVLFFLFISQSFLFAEEAVRLTNKKGVYNVTSYLEMLEDKTRTLTLSTIINSEKELSFKQIDDDTVNLGYTQSAYWFRLKLFNKNRSKPTLLEIPWPHIDNLDIYMLSNKNNGDEEADDVFVSYNSGRLIPYNKRNYEHRNFVFKIPNFPNGDELVIYMRVVSDETIIFPVYLYDEMKFFKKDQSEEFVFGIYYGVVIIMFFYNLFIYLSLRDKNYFIYLFYVIALGLYQLSMNGIIYAYWPNYPMWNKLFLPLSSAILQFILIILFKNLLNIEERYSWERKSLFVLTILSFISIILVITVDYATIIVPMNILGFIYMITSILIVVRAVINGNRTAIFFLITWITFLAGGIILTLRNFNILPQNFLTTYSLQIGSTIEMLLLSLALTDRINTMKMELAILNTKLEEKVEERTKELSRVLGILQAKELTIDSELDLASDLQKCIFPSNDLPYPHIKFVGYYEYLMKVGGDFYDVVPLPNNAVGILIADVSGHGIPAALLSTMYKISFMNATRRTSSPVKIFQEVNKNISSIMTTHDYLTALIIVIEPNGRICFSSAAHRPAFLFRKKTKKLEVVSTKGMFIGMLSYASDTFEEKESKMDVGDRILLFTDGVIDAFNEKEERWSSDELQKAFIKSSGLSLEAALESIKADWIKFRGNTKINDDSTLLLIEYTNKK
ncbi:MAG TPA: 7TM diverse intracellular signaling domain-containing protein [Leptospiraceae bacterium]|nr:7TM diverse intracellular signaling domain-containing protein [Leptospiraceae bacterium]HMW06411.1 7TM diverse intracellular signaling domain-containing protein [Leptospiraceae bacterium]HMX31677.1 7TM diverse intracellular signaling domain-containing protein [Leptospiraceae bacterium]HMY31963.1 7TM diverse intracellular signaling domain-containing protein [Leptospiraceae bacterium]HMZ63173.1 7TM diverse intracellular signaling domain-containing protein [Leptospiraceae bacterium]